MDIRVGRWLELMTLEDRTTPYFPSTFNPTLPIASFDALIDPTNQATYRYAISDPLTNDGFVVTASEPTSKLIHVGRVFSDGSIDKSFGQQGVTTIVQDFTLPGFTNNYVDLICVSGSRIVIHYSVNVPADENRAGALIALNTIGQLDATFGNQGWVPVSVADTPDLFHTTDLAFDSTGGVLLAGENGRTPISNKNGVITIGENPATAQFVTRYTAAGSIDMTFGNSGWSPLITIKHAQFGVQPGTDRLIFSGTMIANGSSDNKDIAVVALTPSGKIDPNFGTSGTVRIGIDQPGSTKVDTPESLFFRDDGSMFVIGSTNRKVVPYQSKLQSGAIVTTQGMLDDTFFLGLNPHGVPDLSVGNKGYRIYTTINVSQPGQQNLRSFVFSPERGSAGSFLVRQSIWGIENSYSGSLMNQVLRIHSSGEADSDYGPQGFRAVTANDFLEQPAVTGSVPSIPVLVGGLPRGETTILDGGTDTLAKTGTAIFSRGSLTRTVTADVNGDGIEDLIGVAGVGSRPYVVVIDGRTKFRIAEFDAFEKTFTGGLNISARDLTGDGLAELIITPDQGGGPIVAIYDGSFLSRGYNGEAQLARFFGIDDKNFRGGARTSLGRVNDDSRFDLVVAAGYGGGPRIALYDGGHFVRGMTIAPPKLIPDFFAFEPSLRNGAFVTLGDLNGDGQAELVFGGGPGGAPRVRAFDGKGLLAAGPFTSLDHIPDAQLANFFAAGAERRGGIRLAIKDIDGSPALLAGSGENEAAQLRVFPAATLFGSANPQPSQVLDLFNGAVLVDGVFVG
jgi:uncharacterized delta-60 repeat protein